VFCFPLEQGRRSRLAHEQSPSRRARLPGRRGAYPQHAPMAAPPPCSLLNGTPRAHAICARLCRRGTVPVIHSSRGNSPSPSLSRSLSENQQRSDGDLCRAGSLHLDWNQNQHWDFCLGSRGLLFGRRRRNKDQFRPIRIFVLAETRTSMNKLGLCVKSCHGKG
jgi:hypothetical protein